MSFPIQKKLPTKNNKFYNTTSVGGYSHCIKGKPTQSGLNVLDNCVGWACGRFNEIYSYLTGYKGMKYWELNCNAEDFITRGKKIGLNVSKEPVLAGIMVWQGIDTKTTKRAGHVAVVEEIKSNNEVFTSESGYNSFAFANKIRSKGNGNWGANSNYKYLGCLINPGIKDTKKYIQLIGNVWCRTGGIGFNRPKYKVIPKNTKCELLAKNVGKANGYNWDKIKYNNKVVYLPNKWNKYL